MGVTGLWRLLEPAGSLAHLEDLRGRVLAVDISIWLHQMVKGFQDAKGAAVANSHLFGLFQRLCKLLYYGIKPVFVFDGCSPALKRQTIINRQNKKASARNSADKIQQQLMEVIAKHIVVKNSLTTSTNSNKTISPVKKVTVPNEEDLFVLPSIQEDTSEAASAISEEEEEEEVKESVSTKYHIDLHTFDFNSEFYKKLEPREKLDLLTELKETRKENSWGRLHELPKKSQDFSDYQMNRLLKRRQVQVTLEETEKEMGGHCLSINELEILLNEEGIDTKINSIPTRQIASNENTHFVLVKNVKEAMKQAIERESAKKEENQSELPSTSKTSDDLGTEYDEDLEAAIKLSLEVSKDEVVDLTEIPEIVSSSHLKNNKQKENAPIISDASTTSDLTLAKAYMMEFSGLSEYEIDRIIKDQSSKKPEENNAINRNFGEIYENKIIEIPDEKLDDDKESEILKSNVMEKHKSQNPNTNFSVNSESLISCSNEVSVGEKMSEISKTNVGICTEKSVESDKNFNISSCSDSDDSFEEVPELDKTIHKIPNDDIFADVFSDKSKFEDLDKNILSNINCKSQESEKNIGKNLKPFSGIVEEESTNEKSTNKHNESIDKILEVIENDIVIKIEQESEDEGEDFDASELSPHENIHHSDDSTPAENEPSTSEKILDIATILSENPSTKELFVDLEKKLEHQQDFLEKEQNKLDRMGRNITEEMAKDAQGLLKLFGIPYIVAPTEAEAQCAFLESINLTDGTITDDSDIWLFGGKTVYRNFFNQQKHVLKFAYENIIRSFKLQREDLILLALLVGSDYTMGVTGVGPVTGLEILAAFPRSKNETMPPYHPLTQGLKKFREWCSSSSNYTHTKLRSKLKNIALTEEFPNIKVIEAYLCPEVETSKDQFTWGVPDTAALRDYTKEKFGWSREKTDEILNPVLKRLNIKSTQTKIKSFFDTEFKIDVANEKMSKRVRMAIENLGEDKSKPTEQNEVQDEDFKKKPRKRVRKDSDTNKKAKNNPEKEISSTSKLEKINLKIISKETIPQKERDKSLLLKNKLKAIELFRKSKQGPGFVKKRKRTEIQPKDEAELSESSSSD